MLSIGIVGLPNVGKSTLFNALTRSKQADAQNYPFCTIEPNVGVVEVPDDRLQKLSDVSNSKKIIPTAIQFVDIAGLVKGASEGQGLGNQFLSHIRECDAVVQVVRSFEDGNIIHVNNRVNPKEDADVINLELILADLQTVSKRHDNAKRNAKGVIEKKTKIEIEVLEKIKIQLETEKPARLLEFSEDEIEVVRDLHLITMKPMLYVLNVDERITNNEQLTTSSEFENKLELADGRSLIVVSAKLESELAELSPDDAKEYMKELGMTETGLDKLIVAGYKLLDLVTYFTSGEPETRAWTVKQGTCGPDAAGVIHTDFIKGYIKADVVNWKDFVEAGGWNKIKETGKMKLVGKDYVVEDGDVCYFHIST
ncbi:MAG: redox-regulated ATPase YchF [Candidatus Magasanikbacteria bacterium]